jgi:hypothetical protein
MIQVFVRSENSRAEKEFVSLASFIDKTRSLIFRNYGISYSTYSISVVYEYRASQGHIKAISTRTTHTGTIPIFYKLAGYERGRNERWDISDVPVSF